MNLNQLVNAEVNVQTILIGAACLAVLYLIVKTISYVRNAKTTSDTNEKAIKQLKEQLANFKAPAPNNTGLELARACEKAIVSLRQELGNAVVSLKQEVNNVASNNLQTVKLMKELANKPNHAYGSSVANNPASAPRASSTISHASSTHAASTADRPSTAAPSDKVEDLSATIRKHEWDMMTPNSRRQVIRAVVTAPSPYEWRKVSTIAEECGATVDDSFKSLLTEVLRNGHNGKAIKVSRDRERIKTPNKTTAVAAR